MLRCYDPTCKAYKWYGARGIKVVTRWHSYINYFNDMKLGFSWGLEIDRRDNNSNYSPDNCRWVTQAENTRNSNQVKNLFYNGTIMLQADWARKRNIDSSLIGVRLKNGWSIDEALGFIRHKRISKPGSSIINSISEKYYLGELCPQKHEYEGTGKTKRYKSCHKCWKCAVIELANKRARKREQHTAQQTI